MNFLLINQENELHSDTFELQRGHILVLLIHLLILTYY